jgi:mRNA interferase MazF
LELFARGDVVVIPFPFTNLSEQKARPALVLADLAGPDLILCQITTKPGRDRYAVAVDRADFSDGSLKYPSSIRANQIFTLEKTLVRDRVGCLKKEKTEEVVRVVISFLRA